VVLDTAGSPGRVLAAAATVPAVGRSMMILQAAPAAQDASGG
jgi:hypothetical protein